MWRRQMDTLLHFDDLTYLTESESPKKHAEDASVTKWETYEEWEYDSKLERQLLIDFMTDSLVKKIDHLENVK